MKSILFKDIGKAKLRFLKFVLPNPNTGCWEWMGHKKKYGYGDFTVNDSETRAHRVSYTLFKGSIPEGLFVCHKCDIRHCVNPEHLFLGTAKDNSDDKLSKGRQAKGTDITKNHITPKGESHVRAKLTEEDVKEIYYRRINGLQGTKSLAREYGVSPKAIRKIMRGQNWAHLKLTG